MFVIGETWFNFVMRVLITGGTGFIARNLFEQLKDKYNVICLGRKKLNLLNFGRS